MKTFNLHNPQHPIRVSDSKDFDEFISNLKQNRENESKATISTIASTVSTQSSEPSHVDVAQLVRKSSSHHDVFRLHPRILRSKATTPSPIYSSPHILLPSSNPDQQQLDRVLENWQAPFTADQFIEQLTYSMATGDYEQFSQMLKTDPWLLWKLMHKPPMGTLGAQSHVWLPSTLKDEKTGKYAMKWKVQDFVTFRQNMKHLEHLIELEIKKRHHPDTQNRKQSAVDSDEQE